MVLATLVAALLAAGAAAGDPGTDKARIDAQIGDLRSRADQATQSEGVLSTELSGLDGRVRDAEAAVAAEQARLDAARGVPRDRARPGSRRSRADDRRADRAPRRPAAPVRRPRSACSRATCARSTRPTIPDRDRHRARRRLVHRAARHATTSSTRSARQDERIATTLEHAHTRLRADPGGDGAGEGRTQRVRRRLIAARRRGAADQCGTGSSRAGTRSLAARREKSDALSQVQEDKASFIAEAESLVDPERGARGADRRRPAGSAGADLELVRAAASTGALGWPVAGPVTSGFGSRWGRMHEGIDIGVPEGTPVHSAAAGTVIYAGWMSGYGNIVVIDHGNGLSTAYAHNSQLIVGPGSDGRKGLRDRALGQHGPLDGPARPLRGPRERVARRPARVSLRGSKPRRPAEAGHHAASVAAAGSASAGT